MNMDDISLQIIKHLREGRKSFGEIGKNLSITTNTVRARVKKLMKKGILEIIGSINPERIDDHFLVIIGVRLKTMRLVDKGEEFSKLKGVISVAVVTGRFDLFLMVLLNDKFGLSEFLAQEVSKVRHVVSTETFVVYKNINWRVPYCLD